LVHDKSLLCKAQLRASDTSVTNLLTCYFRGDSCKTQVEAGRGGLCSFRFRNIVTAHSFSQFVLKQMGSAQSIAHRTQIIEVERDGTIRNSLSLQAAYSFARQGSDTTFSPKIVICLGCHTVCLPK
jgi:hypothetical protein